MVETAVVRFSPKAFIHQIRLVEAQRTSPLGVYQTVAAELHKV